ncbi:MAG: hypothetical protein ACE14L_17105 [Terriglobales bacterium]
MTDDGLDALCRQAADAALTEDLALSLLERRDLPAEAIECLARNAAVMKGRKVLRAIVAHPHTPRHVSLPRARHLYTFELLQIALAPPVLADVKRMAEEVIVTRLETITVGERLTLARRASTRVAAALLCDREARVRETALENPRLNEAAVIRALQQDDAPEALVHAVCRHPKWSLRRDVQIALVRNSHTPLARAVYFAGTLPVTILRDIVENTQLRPELKVELEREMERRN